MGIYYRYAAAALILLFCADTYAVTRKIVNHGQSKESVIKGSGASFQTPNGEAAYYGRDYVDQHTAGNRFTTNDSPGTSSKQKVTVKPTLKVDPKKAAKSMIGGLRGGVPGVVASAAASAIIAAVDGVIEDSQVKVPTLIEIPPGADPTDYYWISPQLPGQKFNSAYGVVSARIDQFASQTPGTVDHRIGSTRWANDGTVFQFCINFGGTTDGVPKETLKKTS